MSPSPDREAIVNVVIDMASVAAVRRQIPALANRRPGAYRLE